MSLYKLFELYQLFISFRVVLLVFRSFFSRCFNVWRSFFRNSSTYTECEFEPLQQTNRKSFEPSNRLPLYRVEVLFQWMTSLPNFESAYWKIRSHRHFFTSHQFAIFFVLRFSVRNHEWLLELICRTATERHDLRTLFNQYQSILIPWRCVVLFGNDKFDYYWEEKITLILWIWLHWRSD